MSITNLLSFILEVGLLRRHLIPTSCLSRAIFFAGFSRSDIENAFQLAGLREFKFEFCTSFKKGEGASHIFLASGVKT